MKKSFIMGILSGKYSCKFCWNPSDIQIDLSQKPYKFTQSSKIENF